MQEKITTRRSNRDRTAETRAKLIEAARALFVDKGYAETGTPEIVKAAEVTRGALYHHFEDKAALFRAVTQAESSAVTEEINAAAMEATSAIDGLKKGATAYFEAMRVPGRARLMLLDGPAVLGVGIMNEITDETGTGSLREGLALALGPKVQKVPLNELAVTLSAAFDRAALEIANGADPGPYQLAIDHLIDGLLS